MKAYITQEISLIPEVLEDIMEIGFQAENIFVDDLKQHFNIFDKGDTVVLSEIQSKSLSAFIKLGVRVLIPIYDEQSVYVGITEINPQIVIGRMSCNR